MPEQKVRFMDELNRWIEEGVIAELYQAWAEYDEAKSRGEPSEEEDQRLGAAEAEVKKAIRDRVYESYRNGAKAAGQPPPSGAPASSGERKEYRRQFTKRPA